MTKLTCSADAVPSPGYEWLQEIPGTGEVRRRSNSAELILQDVWYADQGVYRCVASNNIGNNIRELQSEPITVDVTGSPQVTSDEREVTGTMAQSVEIFAEFCSDPGPIRNTWQWEGIVLPSGNQYQDGKFEAKMDNILQKIDCYTSSLIINNLASDDMRSYKLVVENIHGTDELDINLIIEDPIPMAAVVGVTLAILIAFLVLVIALLIAYKKEKMCFKIGGSKPLKEDLNENTYSNEAYKLYLNESKKDSMSQKSSVDLVSSHESLHSLPVTNNRHISHLPAGYTSYLNYGNTIYNSTQSLQGFYNYSMPHQFTNLENSEPILSRFPTSLTSSNSRSNIQIYSQLQIPSTSNFGSMKKKKNRDQSIESELSSKDIKDQSLSNNIEKTSDVEYIPDFVSIKSKPVKV